MRGGPDVHQEVHGLERDVSLYVVDLEVLLRVVAAHEAVARLGRVGAVQRLEVGVGGDAAAVVLLLQSASQQDRTGARAGAG